MPKNKRNRHRKTREWRGIDASEAERLTMDKTSEILQGGKITEKANDQLFFVDKNQPKKALTAQEKKEKARNKQLQIDKILAPNPHTKAETQGQQPKKPLQKKIKKRKADDVTPKPANPTEAFFDLWDGPSAGTSGKNSADSMDVDDDGQKEELGKHYSYKAPKPRAGVQTPSKRRHFDEIDAGTSYNPAYDDHQELLGKAVAHHQRIIDEQNRLKKLMKKSKTVEQETVDVVPGMEDEARQVPDEEQDGDNSDSDDVPTEQKHVNQPNANEKTQRERNKEKRRKLHMAQMKKSQWKKKQKAELNRLDDIVREVDEELKAKEERRKTKEMLAQETQGLEVKRLGKMKYQEEEPEYLLTEELPGSLRRLPTGKFSVLKDRFKSLQKRNIIEPRVAKPKRANRYEKKLVEKYSSRALTASEDLYLGK